MHVYLETVANNNGHDMTLYFYPPVHYGSIVLHQTLINHEME